VRQEGDEALPHREKFSANAQVFGHQSSGWWQKQLLCCYVCLADSSMIIDQLTI